MHDDLWIRFTYHAPKEGQPERYQLIRNHAYELADLISTLCPESRELSLAITKIEEAVVLGERSHRTKG